MPPLQLIWINTCFYNHNQTKYMQLFDEYGYRFLFPKDSCQHDFAVQVLEEEDMTPSQLKIAGDILKRAGVIYKQQTKGD